jgi:hypothetical protein
MPPGDARARRLGSASPAPRRLSAGAGGAAASPPAQPAAAGAAAPGGPLSGADLDIIREVILAAEERARREGPRRGGSGAPELTLLRLLDAYEQVCRTRLCYACDKGGGCAPCLALFCRRAATRLALPLPTLPLVAAARRCCRAMAWWRTRTCTTTARCCA